MATWKATSVPRFSPQPRTYGTRIRCPEEETGMNSVRPWTAPRTRARNMRPSLRGNHLRSGRERLGWTHDGDGQIGEGPGVGEALGEIGRDREHGGHRLDRPGLRRVGAGWRQRPEAHDPQDLDLRRPGLGVGPALGERGQ